jgi:hypothetical protein
MTATQPRDYVIVPRFIPAVVLPKNDTEPPARHEAIVYNLSIPIHTASRYMERIWLNPPTLFDAEKTLLNLLCTIYVILL